MRKRIVLAFLIFILVLTPLVPVTTSAADIAASDNGNEYPNSATLQETNPAPTATVLKSVTLSGNNVVISWEPVLDADSYRVYRRTADETEWTRIGTASDTTFTYTKAAPGTTYWYTARAMKDSAFLGSYNKTGLPATVPVPTPTTTVLKSVELSGSNVVISWELLPDAD